MIKLLQIFLIVFTGVSGRLLLRPPNRLDVPLVHKKPLTSPGVSTDEPLDLTPLVESGQTALARNLSAVDPSLFAGVSSHAAFFNVNKTTNGHTFFWFFPVEGLPLESTPWIIWLQGGPGVSSMYGLFEEIGPIKIEDNSAQKMDITWGSDYSLLFIDNPVGAGFSYADEYVTNEDQVGECLLTFLQQFLQVFPELRKAPLFIAGESYAGKYIPAFAHYIHHNKNESMPINLKGLAIGDGWMDPPNMLVYSKALEPIGIISHEQAQTLKQSEDLARKYYQEGDLHNYIKTTINLTNYAYMHAPSPYNYEVGVQVSRAPGGGGDYNSFLNKTSVRTALHVGNATFEDFNSNVYNALVGDMFLTIKPWLEELLELYPIMSYSGQNDIIVAYTVLVNMYRNLKWSGQQAYLKAVREPITNKGNFIGFVREAGNFMEVMVRGAGHMVPEDQPAAAKYVLDMFINKHK